MSAHATPSTRAAPLRAGVAQAPSRLGRDSLADRLAERLAAGIGLGAGALGPGDKLPTEAQLALAHGVSRSVVREAVHRLKSRGLLTSRQGSGVFVQAGQAHQALAFDPVGLQSVLSVVQVVEVRRVLESEIAALAAERATRTQVAGMRRALVAIDAASAAGQDGVTEDLAFHRAIAQATGNPQFGRVIGFLEQYLIDAIRVARTNESRRPDFMAAVRAEHRAIADAIAAGDARKARRAATMHLQHGQRRLEQGGVITRAVAKPARRAVKPVNPTNKDISR